MNPAQPDALPLAAPADPAASLLAHVYGAILSWRVERLAADAAQSEATQPEEQPGEERDAKPAR